MAGGKRGRAKKKQLGVQEQEDKARGKALDSPAEEGRKKKPVQGRARKRAGRTTSSSQNSYVPPKKRARASSSGNRESAAAKAEGHQSNDAKASFINNSPRDPELPPTRSSGLDTCHLAKSGRGHSGPATKSNRRRSFYPETETILGGGNNLPADAPITGSTSHDNRKTSLAELTSPHPDFWIPFGDLQCLENPKISFPLKMRNDGAKSRDILMGSGRQCDYIIFGPEVGEDLFDKFSATNV
ncbi:hypothetical protein FRC01_010438 [Tulasnella sp. 417]|nr:hypothetical protein FRC01_010438 [Tulasnella sp. 417]